jgi:hypothetical protein
MKNTAKWIGVGITLAIAVHALFQVSLGWSMFGFLVAWPIVGMRITIDDDFPREWNNPDGKNPPFWTYGEFWGELILRASLAATGFAFDMGWSSEEAVVLWLFAACGSVAGIVMIKKWPFEVSENDG